MVCVWLARCRDGNPCKFCRVIPTLFGYFFAIPSLHALSFLNDFSKTCSCSFFCGERTIVNMYISVVVWDTHTQCACAVMIEWC